MTVQSHSEISGLESVKRFVRNEWFQAWVNRLCQEWICETVITAGSLLAFGSYCPTVVGFALGYYVEIHFECYCGLWTEEGLC